MTPYTIDLTQHESPQAAGAALAAVIKARKVTCPFCGDRVATYREAGMTLIAYHRSVAYDWLWCSGSDYNMSEIEAAE